MPLGILLPSPGKIEARPDGFWRWFCASLGSFVALQAGFGVERAVDFTVLSTGGVVILALGLAALFVSVATYKRVHWATFLSRSGTVALAIARAGPDVEKFDQFVGSVIDQIELSFAARGDG